MRITEVSMHSFKQFQVLECGLAILNTGIEAFITRTYSSVLDTAGNQKPEVGIDWDQC